MSGRTRSCSPFARRDDGKLVGDCAARPGADDPRIIEIGFSLARSHQGKGYGTEAVRRLLDYLFDDQQGQPAHRVTAGCDVRNTRSVALLERVACAGKRISWSRSGFKGEWISEYRYAGEQTVAAGCGRCGVDQSGGGGLVVEPVGFQKSANAADQGAQRAQLAGHDRQPCPCVCST